MKLFFSPPLERARIITRALFPFFMLLCAFDSPFLYNRLICSYNDGNFSEALGFAEVLYDSLKVTHQGGVDEFIPLLANLYEKNEMYEKAEEFFKRAYEKKVKGSDIFYSAFLRRQKRFDEAEKLLSEKLNSNTDTSSVYLNELALIDYSRAFEGEPNYYADAFELFSRSAGIDSTVWVKGNHAIRVNVTISSPSEEGRYYLGLCLTEVAGGPILLQRLIPSFLLGDNSKVLLKPIEIEGLVELFGSVYIQPSCTLCTSDSAISFDLDTSASLDSTRFPSRSATFSFKLFFLTRSLKSDSFDYIADAPFNEGKVDSLVVSAMRRAIPEKKDVLIRSLSNIFDEEGSYPGVIPDWMVYVKLWADLEETTNCSSRLTLLDSLLMSYPHNPSLLELKAATLILCNQLDYAQALFDSLLTNGKGSRWTYYN